jgi:alanine racemase
MGFRAWGNGVGFISIKDKRQKFRGYLDMLMVDVTEMIVPKEIV